MTSLEIIKLSQFDLINTFVLDISNYLLERSRLSSRASRAKYTVLKSSFLRNSIIYFQIYYLAICCQIISLRSPNTRYILRHNKLLTL